MAPVGAYRHQHQRNASPYMWRDSGYITRSSVARLRLWAVCARGFPGAENLVTKPLGYPGTNSYPGTWAYTPQVHTLVTLCVTSRCTFRVPGTCTRNGMMGHTAARGYPDTRAHGEPGNLGTLVPGYLGTGTGVLLESPVWGTLVVGTRAGSLVDQGTWVQGSCWNLRYGVP